MSLTGRERSPSCVQELLHWQQVVRGPLAHDWANVHRYCSKVRCAYLRRVCNFMSSSSKVTIAPCQSARNRAYVHYHQVSYDVVYKAAR